jgi:hypothetical protein
MAVNGSLTNAQVKALVQSLARAIPAPTVGEDPLIAAIGIDRTGRTADWLFTELLPAACGEKCDNPGDEATVVHSLAGSPDSKPSVIVGTQTYTLRRDSAMLRSMELLRQVDAGLRWEDLAALRRIRGVIERDAANEKELRDLAGQVERIAGMALSTLSPGSPDREVWLAAGPIAASLRGFADRGDLAKQSTALPGLEALVDAATVAVVPGIAYAAAASPALVEPEDWRGLARLHSFGATSVLSCPRCPWMQPVLNVDGNLTFVVGSMIGLDVALAPIRLRRVAPPNLYPGSLNRKLLPFKTATGRLAVLSTLETLAAESHIVAASEKAGRLLSQTWIRGGSVDAAALRRTGLSAGRTNTIIWLVSRGEGERALAMLTATDMFRLGTDLELPATFGGLGAAVDGCQCFESLPRAAAEHWQGHDGSGPLMNFMTSDLQIRVAELLDEMHLPGWLVEPLMPAAIGDMVASAALRGGSNPEDWQAMALSSRLNSEVIRSYLSALVAEKVLVPSDR